MPVQKRVTFKKRGSYFSGKAFERRSAAAAKTSGKWRPSRSASPGARTRRDNAGWVQSMRLSGFTPAMMRGALKEMGVRGRHGVPKSTRKSGGGGGSRSEAARKAWRTRRGH